ncbi:MULTISPECIES: efflux RND transporter permease subunit [Gammaproteobacteria]|jgi:multidrug efflux pump subunit AcrB|uniref:AcrB/AcrD/AcrF family protein n=2 Tax=Gammaproteobacteria TaxID=1236 RepID=A0A2K9LJR7_9GAMM|nr:MULTISPECIES: efflux RND transporter permease subunit [Gammaproteobacteria]ARU56836.1 RND superfamily HAE1 family efflux transporter inner membrane pump subunit [Oleiphilus messinensis]AUM11024.1 AcrB/AcrD/AcrF family protein [Ketobacter alkanivorans]MEE4377608.1 efflux RND transporter permease subunit [Candidatus Competibacteraceae bacterium]
MSFPNLSAIAVRERSVTLYFLVLSIFVGVYAFATLGRAEDPSITLQMLVVSAVWPGATPAEIEQQVVHPIEKNIQKVEYLDEIKTTVKAGRADIQVQFHSYTPQEKMPELQFQVRKRMLDLSSHLPEGVIGPIVNDDFSDVYFSLFSLSAPGLPMRKLTRYAERLRDELQLISGARKADLIGEREERVYVDLNNVVMTNSGITSQAVFDAIRAYNTLIPAGQIDTTGPRLRFRLDADLSDPRRLAQVPIRTGEHIIRLGDIAAITQGYEEPPSYLARVNGEDAMLVGVVMNKGENGLVFGERLDAFLRKTRAELPLGMELVQITNQADAIKAAVNLFQVKFLVAVIVVMGIGFLALGLRAGLIVGVAVPITLGLTFVAMKAADVNLDRITLGALIIALGLLVDDAIIAIEMMLVKLEEGWSKVSAATHAWNATASPMLFGTLVTMFGFVPIGFAKSGVGEYAGNIFWVLAFSLIISWLVAVTFTPYLGVKFLRAPKQKADNHMDDHYKSSQVYEHLRALITWCVRHRRTVVFITFAMLVLGIAGMAGPVEKQFFPGSDRPEILIDVNLPPGTSIITTDATVKRLEELLDSMGGIENYASYVGGGAPRFFISVNPEHPDSSFAKIIVTATGPVERDRIIGALEQHVANGAFAEARIRIRRLLFGPPVDWPVSFRIVGPDPATLRKVAHQVREVMSQNPHVVNPHLEWDQRVPTLKLEMDEQRLRLMGLTPNSVAQQIQYRQEGVPITEVRQDIRTVDVYVRGQGAKPAQNEPPIYELRNEEGQKIPLAHLGEVKLAYEDAMIRRHNRELFLAVRGEVKHAQPQDVTKALWADLESIRVALPDGYRIDIAGSLERSQEAEDSINKVFPLMIALMVTCVMLQMRSFTGVLIVLATAPLGVIGAVLALLVFKQPFGFVALLGLIGLAGILMRNTLILTQQVSDNLNDGMLLSDAVVEAAVRRARPVVLTALAAALAFIPLTTDIFWGPMAYVLIGGVVVGTAITLLFVPALYALAFRLDSR